MKIPCTSASRRRVSSGRGMVVRAGTALVDEALGRGAPEIEVEQQTGAVGPDRAQRLGEVARALEREGPTQKPAETFGVLMAVLTDDEAG